ncbi:MAG: E3 ubiquitin protein ligase, partial [Fuerstiella sp.]|nr:E3 ubiquitin protein ligase [Fuerstiella sp.]
MLERTSQAQRAQENAALPYQRSSLEAASTQNSIVDQFLGIQQMRQAEREQRREAQRRQRGAPVEENIPNRAPAPEPQESPQETAPPTPYAGDEFNCSLCLDDLEEGQRAARLQCRHVFHADCWNRALHSDTTSCPNCRGACQVIAIWNFIGPRPDPTQGAPNLLTTDQDTTVQHLETPRSMLTEREFN